MLEGNVAGADATAWARLRAAGMVLIGRLHCGEFAHLRGDPVLLHLEGSGCNIGDWTHVLWAEIQVIHATRPGRSRRMCPASAR